MHPASIAKRCCCCTPAEPPLLMLPEAGPHRTQYLSVAPNALSARGCRARLSARTSRVLVPAATSGPALGRQGSPPSIPFATDRPDGRSRGRLVVVMTIRRCERWPSRRIVVDAGAIGA